jgi:hypothetical protein
MAVGWIFLKTFFIWRLYQQHPISDQFTNYQSVVQYKEIFLRRYIFHIKLWNKILKPNDNIHFRQNILYNKNLNLKLSNQTCVPDFDQHLITFKFTNLTWFCSWIFITKSRHLWRQQINVEPYLEEADENSYLFFLNDISSQFWSHKGLISFRPLLFFLPFFYFVLLSLVSFYFVFISLISFRFVSILLISFRFVSFSLILFRFVSFRFYFVSFLFRFALYRCPKNVDIKLGSTVRYILHMHVMLE